MVKISALEFENIKRVKAVSLAPAESGLTVIGGKNGQGKTSVLDAIAWALGGDRFRPSEPNREGSVLPPSLKVTLSNGLRVERGGKNGSLKVTDPSGQKGGQALLNEFVEELALDLPKFMNATPREKANILLKVIGVGDKLFALDDEEAKLYNSRHAIGQIADQKKKYAAEMVFYENVPSEPVSAAELIRRQQNILAQNAENRRKRERAAQLKDKAEKLEAEIQRLEREYRAVIGDMEIASMDAADLEDLSTAELEKDIADIDKLNIKIRSNLDKEKAQMEADDFAGQYDALTERIEAVRKERRDLLNAADLPLLGLGVENGELTYNGRRWDCMSGSEQLKTATAIVRKLKPECGFVLIDKLEQMDADTLAEFGRWLEAEGLQAIATRVSQGGECSVIIEDGYASAPAEAQPTKYVKGVF